MEETGIPTRFKGVNFRSRLEAKWAHVFELLEWDWLYEPFDMEGWIPDFLIRSKCSEDLLIDIKPITRFGCRPLEIEDKIDHALSASETPYFAAVLGVAPQDFDGDCLIGTLRWPGADETWDLARFTTCLNERIGLNQVNLTWNCVINNEHSKFLAGGDRDRIERAFREAANRVQWNAKAPRHIADVLAGIQL